MKDKWKQWLGRTDFRIKWEAAKASVKEFDLKAWFLDLRTVKWKLWLQNTKQFFADKNLYELLVLFVLLMPFAFAFFMEFLRLPSLIKYTIDVVWAALAVIILCLRKKRADKHILWLVSIASIFFLLTLVGFAFNFQSVWYYLWGMRNNLRYFVFFFACIWLLRGKSAAEYFKLFDGIFWINFALVLFQFIFLGKKQDFLGGIFGTQVGCNGYMNIFLCIIAAQVLLLYMSHQKGLKPTLIKLGVILLIAALSELKMFFVELVLIALLVMLMTSFSLHNLKIIGGILAGIFVAIQIVSWIFPQFAGWFNIASMWETATSAGGYTGKGDLNRLTAIPIILRDYLPTWFEKLFGLGLGNCDQASYEFLVTPFFRANAHLHYNWFSGAFLVLETGIVGLLLYLSFFGAVFWFAHKREKSGKADVLHCRLAKIMALLVPLLVIYNASMRMEAAYMLYFILALPFVSPGEKNLQSKRTKKKEGERTNA